jgi:hypothetical protein
MTLDEARRSIEDAHQVLRADYWSDVRGVADDLKARLDAGQFADRDAFIEALDQTADGHERVIYTHQAIEALLYSDNDGAYVDDFGPEGVVEDGTIMWSRLAFAAFRADVVEHLRDALGVDVNDPLPAGDDDEDGTRRWPPSAAASARRSRRMASPGPRRCSTAPPTSSRSTRTSGGRP